jgi:cell wall-associated NlpC family hydrolase
MTTPVPSTSQGTVSGLIGNLLGGAAGSLGGTNALQSSIDQLTNAVNNLTNQIGSSNLSGAGTLGQATRQQGLGTTTPFPRMQNQFQPTGGGGNANLGQANISQPNPFGSFASRSGMGIVAGAVTQFGQNQMSPLLTLNQYATSSMTSMGTNGMSQNQAMQMLYRQAGVTPGSLNTIATSAQDAMGMLSPLQQLGGGINVNASSLGRAGMQAAAAFGLTNPTLGATQSGNLAAALYSPQFSQNMLALGYKPIRSMTGGAPLGGAQSAQAILQGLGLNKMSPTNLYGNLASGRGQAALSALFGSSGISNSQAVSFLTGYNDLFSKGLNANQANSLFSQAMSGNIKQAKAAQAQLAKYGVTTSANDIQALKNSQAVVTGRESTYAGGFNNAIQDSTGLLEKFNSALTSILQTTGLGGAMGYGGAFGAVLSGTSHGVGLGLGIGGTMMASRFLGLGGSAGGGLLSTLFGGAGGAGAGAAGGASIAAIGSALGVAAGGALVTFFAANIGKKLDSVVSSKLGLNKGQRNSWLSSIAGDLHLGSAVSAVGSTFPGLGVATSLFTGHMAGIGGGAAGAAPTTTQSKTGGNNMAGGVSGQAKAAVGAAESQLGVPYVYGDEIPGVGFDCSGLVQWAYKQAGINLPRTSQAMWSDLKKRRIPLTQVQEGDLLFTAGSDGTANSPGHVAMMVSNRQLIQAPYTGQDVQLTGYNPNGWLYAARPTGNGAFGSSSTSTASSMTAAGPGGSGLVGNRGASGSSGNYGSANEVDLISAMGGVGGGYGGSLTGSGGNGAGTTANSNGTSGKSGGSVAGISGGGSIAANKKLMKQMAQAMYGWGNGSQWSALNSVEMAEAGYNNNAQNPTSTAYGIGQFLNSTWAPYGPKTSNPKLQIEYMLEYIKSRYGSPTGAWAHEQQYHWYGEGGMVQPGMSIVGERGPELMMTSGGRTQVFSNSQTMALINQIKGNVPQNPWKSDLSSGGSSTANTSQGTTLQVNFNAGSITIQSNSGGSVASNAGREVARQVVSHLNSEAVSQAIRNGNKL